MKNVIHEELEQILCEKNTAHGTARHRGNRLNQSHSARPFLIQSECWDTAMSQSRHARPYRNFFTVILNPLNLIHNLITYDMNSNLGELFKCFSDFSSALQLPVCLYHSILRPFYIALIYCFYIKYLEANDEMYKPSAENLCPLI
jgi:hypothetical protein